MRSSILWFQTRTGHLSHSTPATSGAGQLTRHGFKPGRATSPIPPRKPTAWSRRKQRVSNPDGPPLPFHHESRLHPTTIRGSFKPGRATSPIPPGHGPTRGIHRVTSFKPGRATSPIPPLLLLQPQMQQRQFQTRTGHLSHSTVNTAAVLLAYTGVSNPDGPPLPFHR